MATIVVTELSNALDGLDLGGFDIANVTLTARTHSQISASLNGFSLTLLGSFYYDVQGYPTAPSSISSLTLTYNFAPVLTAEGLNLAFADLAHGDIDAALWAAFGGDDSYTSAYNGGDYVETYGGNDYIRTGRGNDTIDGGRGTDVFAVSGARADYGFSPASYSLQMNGPDGETDVLRNIEQIAFSDASINLFNGGYGGDSVSFAGASLGSLLFGNGSADTLTGGSGEDTLHGGQGEDELNGGLGNDRLFGGTSADRILGGHGDDLLAGEADEDTLSGGVGRDTLKGGAGSDTLQGQDGRDRLSGGGGSDELDGGNRADSLLGGGGNDVLRGGNGSDVLSGQSGNDMLIGGSGSDQLSGGGGRDVLTGHKGDDILSGGARGDIFVFHKGHGNDTITDFTIGSDHIGIGRGASRMAQLEFTQQGDDVLVAFADVTVLVEDTTAAQLQDADNFLF